MRIGLVRHFRVLCPHKTFMTSSEFARWAKEYEQAMVHIIPVEMNGVKWDICYVSNLPRAITTANEIFHGPKKIEPLLKEVGTAPFTTKDQIKLPFCLWHIFGRIAWFLGKDNQPESRKETRKRIRTFLSKIDWSNDNILIVSHAFTMYNMQHELRRLGFQGKRISRIRNGVLYEFVFDGKGNQVRRWRRQCIRKKYKDLQKPVEKSIQKPMQVDREAVAVDMQGAEGRVASERKMRQDNGQRDSISDLVNCEREVASELKLNEDNRQQARLSNLVDCRGKVASRHKLRKDDPGKASTSKLVMDGRLMELGRKFSEDDRRKALLSDLMKYGRKVASGWKLNAYASRKVRLVNIIKSKKKKYIKLDL